ncbi:hypothetical protein HDZ31DRAFT_31981 [Schizophyllum fasciatum]
MENIEFIVPRRAIVEALTRDLQKHDDEGWMNFPNRPQIQALVAKMRSRSGRTALRCPKRGERGAEEAGNAARAGLGEEVWKHHVIAVDPHKVRGASLHKMSQKKIYAYLRDSAKPGVRKQTAPNLQKVKQAVQEATKARVSDRQVWRSLGRKAISRNVRQFLYKMMHDAHRCGRHWEDIPNCEERVYCHHCSNENERIEESMEHILTECEAPGRREIWAEAERLCSSSTIPWHGAHVGAILGCAAMPVVDEEGAVREGATRFYQIAVMSESAYLIWRVRNERVIQNENDPARYAGENELKEKLHAQLRRRRTIDRALTDSRRFGPKAIPPELACDTWKDIKIDPPGHVPRQQAAGPSL